MVFEKPKNQNSMDNAGGMRAPSTGVGHPVVGSLGYLAPRVASAIAAPASGRGGQNLDAAFILADGGPRGYADPSFDAHLLPIGQWASAVREEWLSERSLQEILSTVVTNIDKVRNA